MYHVVDNIVLDEAMYHVLVDVILDRVPLHVLFNDGFNGFVHAILFDNVPRTPPLVEKVF